jgi:hypothetical protein
MTKIRELSPPLLFNESASLKALVTVVVTDGDSTRVNPCIYREFSRSLSVIERGGDTSLEKANCHQVSPLQGQQTGHSPPKLERFAAPGIRRVRRSALRITLMDRDFGLGAGRRLLRSIYATDEKHFLDLLVCDQTLAVSGFDASR